MPPKPAPCPNSWILKPCTRSRPAEPRIIWRRRARSSRSARRSSRGADTQVKVLHHKRREAKQARKNRVYWGGGARVRREAPADLQGALIPRSKSFTTKGAKDTKGTRGRFVFSRIPSCPSVVIAFQRPHFETRRGAPPETRSPARRSRPRAESQRES